MLPFFLIDIESNTSSCKYARYFTVHMSESAIRPNKKFMAGGGALTVGDRVRSDKEKPIVGHFSIHRLAKRFTSNFGD